MCVALFANSDLPPVFPSLFDYNWKDWIEANLKKKLMQPKELPIRVRKGPYMRTQL